MLKVNVLILGKSGCGKSSLLNYLWGAKVADVAAGRPVTPESDGTSQGIYCYPPVQLDGLQLVILDSWGMEANKAEKWQALIKQESQKCDASHSISDWIHTVIYCISAVGARIEDFELRSVIAPLIEGGNRVLFVLTKADLASEQEKQDLREILTREVPGSSGIIEVGSCSEELRNHQRTEVFGREETLEAILSNLRQNLIEKIPAQLLLRARKGLGALRRDALDHYEEEAGFTRTYSGVLGEVDSLIHDRLRLLNSTIFQWLRQTLKDAAAIYGLVGAQLVQDCLFWRDATLGAESFLNENSVAWKMEEYIANFVFHAVPGLNLIFLFAKKDMHREILIEKLDGVIKQVEKEVEVSAWQIRKRLGEVLALPTPVAG